MIYTDHSLAYNTADKTGTVTEKSFAAYLVGGNKVHRQINCSKMYAPFDWLSSEADDVIMSTIP